VEPTTCTRQRDRESDTVLKLHGGHSHEANSKYENTSMWKCVSQSASELEALISFNAAAGTAETHRRDEAAVVPPVGAEFEQALNADLQPLGLRKRASSSSDY